MSSIVHSTVEIQASPVQKSAVPSWLEEVVLMAAFLKEHHLLTSLADQVRFSRARMGRFDLIDFVVVLLGYALSGKQPARLLSATRRLWRAVWVCFSGSAA